jgi:predicted transcriptional regulator of viral defense system
MTQALATANAYANASPMPAPTIDPVVRAAVKGKGTFSLGQIADVVGASPMVVFAVLEQMVEEGSLRRLSAGRGVPGVRT